MWLKDSEKRGSRRGERREDGIPTRDKNQLRTGLQKIVRWNNRGFSRGNSKKGIK